MDKFGSPLRCAAQVATEGFAPFRLEPTTFSYAEVRTPDVELLVAEDAVRLSGRSSY